MKTFITAHYTHSDVDARTTRSVSIPLHLPANVAELVGYGLLWQLGLTAADGLTEVVHTHDGNKYHDAPDSERVAWRLVKRLLTAVHRSDVPMLDLGPIAATEAAEQRMAEVWRNVDAEDTHRDGGEYSSPLDRAQAECSDYLSKQQPETPPNTTVVERSATGWRVRFDADVLASIRASLLCQLIDAACYEQQVTVTLLHASGDTSTKRGVPCIDDDDTVRFKHKSGVTPWYSIADVPGNTMPTVVSVVVNPASLRVHELARAIGVEAPRLRDWLGTKSVMSHLAELSPTPSTDGRTRITHDLRNLGLTSAAWNDDDTHHAITLSADDGAKLCGRPEVAAKISALLRGESTIVETVAEIDGEKLGNLSAWIVKHVDGDAFVAGEHAVEVALRLLSEHARLRQRLCVLLGVPMHASDSSMLAEVSTLVDHEGALAESHSSRLRTDAKIVAQVLHAKVEVWNLENVGKARAALRNHAGIFRTEVDRFLAHPGWHHVLAAMIGEGRKCTGLSSIFAAGLAVIDTTPDTYVCPTEIPPDEPNTIDAHVCWLAAAMNIPTALLRDRLGTKPSDLEDTLTTREAQLAEVLGLDAENTDITWDDMLAELRRRLQVPALPEGWQRLENDSIGPRVVGPFGMRVELDFSSGVRWLLVSDGEDATQTPFDVVQAFVSMVADVP